MRSELSHRTNRCQNHFHRRLCNGSEWYRPENPNPIPFNETLSSSSPSNPSTVFVQEDTHPVVNIEQRPPTISPDVLIYDPYPNLQPTANIDSNNIRDGQPATDSVPFSSQNITPANAHATRHQSSSRCPYYRRLSMSGYHNMPNHYHSPLQNVNGYLRPAYAPHESLWHRQQNNQEVHRRHMMNSMSGSGVTNDSTAPSSFGTYASRVGASSNPNGAYCMQCDQQHPIGHPHRRIAARQYICGLNSVI